MTFLNVNWYSLLSRIENPDGIPLLNGELGRYEGVRFISHGEPVRPARIKKIYQRPAKEPNPEIQTAAEAKRQRKLERNRRLQK